MGFADATGAAPAERWGVLPSLIWKAAPDADERAPLRAAIAPALTVSILTGLASLPARQNLPLPVNNALTARQKLRTTSDDWVG